MSNTPKNFFTFRNFHLALRSFVFLRFARIKQVHLTWFNFVCTHNVNSLRNIKFSCDSSIYWWNQIALTVNASYTLKMSTWASTNTVVNDTVWFSSCRCQSFSSFNNILTKQLVSIWTSAFVFISTVPLSRTNSSSSWRILL